MKAHIETWMDAYLDGELPEIHLRRVEAHLAQCPACRQQLEQRRALLTLLQAAPPAVEQKTAARFEAEVRMRLRRRPAAPPVAPRALLLAWRLIPALLLLGWVFVRTVLLVSSLLGIVPGARQALLVGPVGGGRLPAPAGELLGLAAGWYPLRWDFPAGLGLLALIGLLYLGWLAGWWVRRRREQE